MKMLRDFGKTALHVLALLSVVAVLGNLAVVQGVKAQSSWLNASQIESLRLILNTFGVAVWPNHTADPVTCSADVEGAYYFNTTSSTFQVCDGTTWAAGGGGVAALNDLTDVTIATPSDGQALVYDGVTDMRWENTAQSASDLNDLADVEAPTPSDGDIIVYDGVTDNRWESIAGAAPTTLAGQSDVTLATPANSERLVRGVTDWNNVDTRGSFHMFPFDFIMSNHAFTANQICATDNDLRVYRTEFDTPCTVDRVVWGLENDGTNCLTGSVGLYTLDGLTKVVDSGVATYSASNTIQNQDPADVYVEEGSYWLAYTSNECSSSCTVTSSANPTPTSNINIDEILNTGSTLFGTPANQSVAGALPATLGTITANTLTNLHRPLVKFVCTDP